MKLAPLATGVGAVAAVLQLTYVFGLADPGPFTERGVQVSGLLNLALFPIGLAFTAVNHVAQRRWKARELTIYRASLLGLFVALLLQSLGHVFNAGFANSVVSGYFIMGVVLAAWFLPTREFRIFAGLAVAGALAGVVLESTGALPHAPIFRRRDAFSDIFLAPEIAYGSFAMVAIWTVLIGGTVRHVRARLVRSHIELERQVEVRGAALKRSLAQEEALRDRLAHTSRVASLGELTASIAHELNQPLAAIRNNASAGRRMLAAPSPDREALADVFEDIVADDERAAEVIKALRRLFGAGAIEWEAVSLADVVADVRTLTRKEIAESRLRLETDLAEGLGPVRADRVQLDHLLLNLVLNAMDALRSAEVADGRILVAAREVGDRVELSVRDDGPGFDDDLLPRLFESFVTTKADGLGIGLSLCRTIATRHGGDIRAANHPDGGAVVRVTLPQAPAEGAG